MTNDELFMQRALQLAKKGIGKTSPNPMVGAVIVKDGKIIGEGYHKEAGGPHAEVEALKGAKEEVKGGTLYVSLEPCCHCGKTPPCTDAIINAGISRVVIATEDPNPMVSRKGIACLKAAGIEVLVGVLKEEGMKLNEVFFKYITQKTPFVVAKIAQTIDGKIALSSGESKWITCLESRKKGHELRNIYDSIMVGIGTILADDPMLTCRLPDKTKDPVKIIMDSKARLPFGSKVLMGNDSKVVLATTENADTARVQTLENMGVKIIKTSGKDKVNIKQLLLKLGDMGITSMLIEGGPTVLSSFVKEDLIDKFTVFLAPKFIGGDGKSAIADLNIKDLQDVNNLQITNVEKIGQDVMLEIYPIRH